MKSNVKKLLLLSFLGMAMGWWEAVVVVYLRQILRLGNAVDLNSSVLEEVPPSLLSTEQTRELAPIIILVCVSFLAERNRWRRLGVFLWTFALWDIFYYAGLKVQLDWPSSLKTADCLFLIPVPWIAPVWFPLAVMLSFIVISILIFLKVKETDGRL